MEYVLWAVAARLRTKEIGVRPQPSTFVAETKSNEYVGTILKEKQV
jgi:hypothetical protein